MDPYDALQTIAEIAIAIAGFAGIVAVMGRRVDGAWTDADRFRLTNLLRLSFEIVMFAFVPIVMALAAIPAATLWAAASALRGVYVFAAVGITLRRVRAAWLDDPAEVSVALVALTTTLSTLGLILLGFNVVSARTAWPYVLVMVMGLVGPFSMFMRLLYGSLAPTAADDGPP